MKKAQKMQEQKRLSACQVCFIQSKPQFANKLTHYLRCNKCERSVHRFCYQPNCSDPHNFVCDVCLYWKNQQVKQIRSSSKSKAKCNKKLTEVQPLCFACLNPGMLKKVSQKLYGHPICLMFIDEIFVNSYENLSFDVLQYKAGGRRKFYDCSICSNRSHYVTKCFDRNCSKYAHWYCIFRQGLKIQTDEGKWIQDLQIISSQCFNYLQIFVKKLKKATQAWSNPLSKLLWPAQSQKINQPVKIVYCPDHELNLINCKCIAETPIIEETEWVACDCCYKWYHFDCENITSQQQLGQSYMCLQCRQWHRIVEQQKIPILMYYPKMHYYDFVYIQYFASKRKYKDQQIENKLLKKLLFLPSLQYANQFKNMHVNPQIVTKIKLQIIKKQTGTLDIQTLDKNVKATKKQLINNFNKMQLYISTDLFDALRSLHQKKWSYRQVLQICQKFHQFYKKDSEMMKSIIGKLKSIDNDDEQDQEDKKQLQQIKQSSNILKEGISLLKKQNQGSANVKQNVLKFYQLIKNNPLLMRHIKYNVVGQKQRGWKNFEGCCVFQKSQDILSHSILLKKYSQYVKLRKQPNISLNYILSLGGQYEKQYFASSQCVRKQNLSCYHEVSSDVNRSNDCFQQSGQQQQPIIMKLRFQKKTKNCRDKSQQLKSTLFQYQGPLQNSIEQQTKQKNVSPFQNSTSSQSVCSPGLQFSQYFCYSKHQCTQFSAQIMNTMLMKWFYSFIKKLKLNKKSFHIMKTKSELISVYEKNQHARKIGVSFSHLYQICEYFLSNAKNYIYHDNQCDMSFIKNICINAGNIEAFTVFLSEVLKVGQIQYLQKSIKMDIQFKCIEYLHYLFSRQPYFGNELQFKVSSIIFNKFYNELCQNQVVSCYIQQLQSIIIKNEKFVEIMYQVNIKLTQDPNKLEHNLKCLRQAYNLCTNNQLGFYTNKVLYLIKMYQAFEQGILWIPHKLIGLQTGTIPAQYLKNKQQTIDIEIVRNYLKRLQLIQYPPTSSMYNRIMAEYSKSQKVYQILFALIKQRNKLLYNQNQSFGCNDRNVCTNLQIFKKQTIINIIECPPSFIVFEAQAIEAKYICDQYDKTLLIAKLLLQTQQKSSHSQFLNVYQQILKFPFELDSDIIRLLQIKIKFSYPKNDKNVIKHNNNLQLNETLLHQNLSKQYGSNELLELLQNISVNQHKYSLNHCQQFLSKLNTARIHPEHKEQLKYFHEIIAKSDKLRLQVKQRTEGRKRKKNSSADAKYIEVIKKQYNKCILKIEEVQQLISQANKLSNCFGFRKDSLSWATDDHRKSS